MIIITDRAGFLLIEIPSVAGSVGNYIGLILMKIELFQFGEDIWITDKPVLHHTDSTAEGMLTYGLVLINTGYYLVYDGKKYEIPVNSIYEIDGRKEHSTEGNGILCLLIWDMPDWNLKIFENELRRDIRFKNFGEILLGCTSCGAIDPPNPLGGLGLKS